MNIGAEFLANSARSRQSCAVVKMRGRRMREANDRPRSPRVKDVARKRGVGG
jgi:hypothetical protein